MKRDCRFCEIAAGAEAHRKVYEDDQALAFLTIKPIRPGHLLVIPKQHIEEFTEMDASLYTHLMRVVQQMAQLLKAKLQPRKVGVWIHGFEIPHLHIHVFPLAQNGDVNIKPRKTNGKNLAAMAEKLKS